MHRAKVGKRESPVKGSWRQPIERKKDEGRSRQRMKATEGKQQGVQGAEGREGTGGQLGSGRGGRTGRGPEAGRGRYLSLCLCSCHGIT